MKNFKTEQEKFWSGTFGDEYISRNQGKELLASNISLFAKILSRSNSIESVIEFGANVGMNLQAIKQLMPSAELTAVEINKTAVEKLEELENIKVNHESVLEFEPDKKWDFVLIKGVLIHINPSSLTEVYQKLYHSSNHYICIAEYYNPTPVEVQYRGHSGKLFKRDFAGEILDMFRDLKLVDYGFAYHRDPQFPQDDTTWFLLEKRNY